MEARAASFEAILFDLDGTLLDSVPLILESYRHTLAAHGLPPQPDEIILEGLGTPLEAQFARWVEPQRVAPLVDSYIAHNLSIHDAYVRPFPGVCEVVRTLRERGDRLAVVTSKRRVGTERGLAALGLSDCFDHLVCADDVERPKPHPEPVLRALQVLGASPERSLFVGDATHDVHAGRAAGVRTAAVLWGAASRSDLEPSRPDHWVRDAAELGALLDARRARP